MIHHPNCDADDKSPEGILKPCNCRDVTPYAEVNIANRAVLVCMGGIADWVRDKPVGEDTQGRLTDGCDFWLASVWVSRMLAQGELEKPSVVNGKALRTLVGALDLSIRGANLAESDGAIPAEYRKEFKDTVAQYQRAHDFFAKLITRVYPS